MKRIFVLLLCAFLIFGVVGCGGSDNSSDTPSVTSAPNNNDSSSDTVSKVEPLDPPKVKDMVSSIADGGLGSAGVDSISNESITLTPPDYNGGTVTYNDLDDRSTLLSAAETSLNEYNGYLTQLEGLGYIKVVGDRSIIETDNRAAVYTNGRYLVSTNYIAYNDTAKIMVDELGISSVEAVNKYLSVFDADFCVKNIVAEPLFISLGLSTTDDKNRVGYYNTGLSYMLRLSDGSFVIIDGGDIKEANDHAGRLMSVINHYAVDKNNVRIAAWIITHPHGDHAKAFTQFYGNYINGSTTVKLEKIIANIPNYTTAVAATSEGQLLLNQTLREIFYQAKQNGTDIYKAHTGQVYNLCGLQLEMLYTYDVTLPQKMVKGMDNTFSLCFNMYFEDKVIHINGDATSVSITAMNNMYKHNLKCDIVQVPHHGTVSNFKSSTDADKQAKNFEQLSLFYTENTKASYAIWPSTERGKQYYLSINASTNPNSVLKEIMPSDNIYANGHNVKEFKFTNGTLSVTEYSYKDIGYSK